MHHHQPEAPVWRVPRPFGWRRLALLSVLVVILAGILEALGQAAPVEAAPSSALPAAPDLAADVPAALGALVLPVPVEVPALLLELMALPSDAPYPGRLLGRGLVGEDVRQVQAFLNTQGVTLKVDGIYGPRTARAVRRFQRKVGVAVDGIVGPITWSKGPALAAAPPPAQPTTPPTPPATPPTTTPPTTARPTTTAAPATTAAPTTAAPTTRAPTTAAPTTAAPTSVAPTSIGPTSIGPATSVTSTAPSTTGGPTTTGGTTTTTAEAPPEQALPPPSSGESSRSGSVWIVIAATLALIAALIAVAVLGRRRDLADRPANGATRNDSNGPSGPQRPPQGRTAADGPKKPKGKPR